MMVKLSKSSPIPAQSEFQQKNFPHIYRGFHTRALPRVVADDQGLDLRCYKVYKLHKCLNIE